MGMMNHFLDVKIVGDVVIPFAVEAPNTNSQASIQAQAELCRSMHGRVPNVILVSCSLLGLMTD